MRRTIKCNTIHLCIAVFTFCLLVRFAEYFLIKTDQTAIGENVLHKAVGIIILALALKRANLSWSDIGFQRNGFVRACLISSDEDGNEGESKNLSRNNEFTLTIFPKPAEFVQPAEKALYHPTTRQHNKSV